MNAPFVAPPFLCLLSAFLVTDWINYMKNHTWRHLCLVQWKISQIDVLSPNFHTWRYATNEESLAFLFVWNGVPVCCQGCPWLLDSSDSPSLASWVAWTYWCIAPSLCPAKESLILKEYVILKQGIDYRQITLEEAENSWGPGWKVLFPEDVTRGQSRLSQSLRCFCLFVLFLCFKITKL